MAKTSEMDLRDYGRILSRRKWWVLGSVLCGVAFAMTLNTITDPVYRATVRIQISREPSRSLLTGEMLENPTTQSDNLALYTAAELITNRKLLARVVGTLREQGVLGGDEKPVAPWYRTLFNGRSATGAVAQLAGPTDTGDPLAAAVPQSQVDWLLGHISVEPVRDTRLVNIHVEHSKPRSAEQIANTVADMFVQYQVEQRSAGSSNLVTYLTTQIQEVRLSLQAAERASAHVKASADRAGAAERYSRLRDAAASDKVDLERLPVQSASLDALKKQLLDSETELAKARGIYKDRHPRLVMLESENESIRANIRHELEDAVAAARNELNAADARARSLTSPDEGSGSRNLATLESEITNQRELYNALLTKLKEAEITGQARGPLVEVIEPAAANSSPVRPRKLLNLIVCLFAGLTIGTGLAFLREYLRRTIRTPQDVDDYLQLPVMGLIPKA